MNGVSASVATKGDTQGSLQSDIQGGFADVGLSLGFANVILGSDGAKIDMPRDFATVVMPRGLGCV